MAETNSDACFASTTTLDDLTPCAGKPNDRAHEHITKMRDQVEPTAIPAFVAPPPLSERGIESNPSCVWIHNIHPRHSIINLS